MLKPITFSSLIELIENDTELLARRRRDIVSAIRTFARVLDISIEHGPVGIRPHRSKLENFEPEMADMSRKRWSNIRSDYRFALERYGFQERRPRPKDRPPLDETLQRDPTPAWYGRIHAPHPGAGV